MVRHAKGQRKIDYVANVLERLGLGNYDGNQQFVSTALILKVCEKLPTLDMTASTPSRHDAIMSIYDHINPLQEDDSGEYFTISTLRTTQRFWKELSETLPALTSLEESDTQSEVKYDVHQVSVGELLSRNADGTPTFLGLNLHIPDFQRPFRWTRKQWLDLLDTIKRGLPMGPLVFAERKDKGRWDVIDGSQRLRSFQMMLSGDRNAERLGIDSRLEELIRDYQLVAYAIYDSESYDYDDQVLTVFNRLNITGKKLTSGELRASRHLDGVLGQSIMREVRRVNGLLSEQNEIQSFEPFVSELSHVRRPDKTPKSVTMESDAHLSSELSIYNAITRRMAYGQPGDGSTNTVINEFFKQHANKDLSWCENEILRVRESINLAVELIEPDDGLGRPPKPSQELIDRLISNNRWDEGWETKRFPYSQWLLCTLSIGLDRQRSDSPDVFVESAKRKSRMLKEQWMDFYWTKMHAVNQSSTNVWTLQREWCNIVDMIVH